MKDAIHALKYGGLCPASQPLGQFLAHAIAQLAGVAPAELLAIPVPLHRSKQTGRGFNQALLLAVSALSVLRRTHSAWRLELRSDILTRHRDTESQAGLTPRQRRLNLRGAFRVSDSAAVNGKHVLLIDDILTTGATARAAAKALVDAGAETVWVATLARARMTNSHRFGFSAANDAAAWTDEGMSAASFVDAGSGPHLQPASMYSQDQRFF